MSETNWAILRQSFLASYETLSRKLTRRFGSADFASDVLHDTYMRIERGGPIGPVSHPESYLMRIAENIAHNSRRRTNRLMSLDEAEEVLASAEDDAPDQARIMAARQELALVRATVANMAPRRRQLFLAAWVDGKTAPEIAPQFGLSTRAVQREIQLAREEISGALAKKLKRRSGL
jgi:RNA polymerase sigma-70 factor (ECF subfamily)